MGVAGARSLVLRHMQRGLVDQVSLLLGEAHQDPGANALAAADVEPSLIVIHVEKL
jgi:hypothetical protein